VNQAAEHHGKFLHRHRWFTAFKWAIYCLLAINCWYFLQEDLASLTAMFEGQVTMDNIIQVFSAFMDTLGWLILLLIFEFETAIIPDDMLQGALKWILLGLKLVCYFFIITAFFGYFAEFVAFRDVIPFSTADVCSLADSGWNYVAKLDDYPPLDAVSCLALQGQELFRLPGTELIGTQEGMAHARRLTDIDVINAATWLVIVAVLEVEVWLQIKDRLSDRWLRFSVVMKAVLYFTLFVCAVWWFIDGDFIDWWDAFLWLVAFIFIEMNIFQWHEEVESHHPDIALAAG
jgi:hypothetical protein